MHNVTNCKSSVMETSLYGHLLIHLANYEFNKWSMKRLLLAVNSVKMVPSGELFAFSIHVDYTDKWATFKVECSQ